MILSPTHSFFHPAGSRIGRQPNTIKHALYLEAEKQMSRQNDFSEEGAVGLEPMSPKSSPLSLDSVTLEACQSNESEAVRKVMEGNVHRKDDERQNHTKSDHPENLLLKHFYYPLKNPADSDVLDFSNHMSFAPQYKGAIVSPGKISSSRNPSFNLSMKHNSHAHRHSHPHPHPLSSPLPFSLTNDGTVPHDKSSHKIHRNYSQMLQSYPYDKEKANYERRSTKPHLPHLPTSVSSPSHFPMCHSIETVKNIPHYPPPLTLPDKMDYSQLQSSHIELASSAQPGLSFQKPRSLKKLHLYSKIGYPYPLETDQPASDFGSGQVNTMYNSGRSVVAQQPHLEIHDVKAYLCQCHDLKCPQAHASHIESSPSHQLPPYVLYPHRKSTSPTSLSPHHSLAPPPPQPPLLQKHLDRQTQNKEDQLTDHSPTPLISNKSIPLLLPYTDYQKNSHHSACNDPSPSDVPTVLLSPNKVTKANEGAILHQSMPENLTDRKKGMDDANSIRVSSSVTLASRNTPPMQSDTFLATGPSMHFPICPPTQMHVSPPIKESAPPIKESPPPVAEIPDQGEGAESANEQKTSSGSKNDALNWGGVQKLMKEACKEVDHLSLVVSLHLFCFFFFLG